VRPDFPLPDIEWEPTRPFWAAAQREELQIPCCDACGRYQWYPRKVCRECEGTASTWTPVSGRATLFSWVVVIHPFLPQFRAKVPFVSALVALEEDPAVRLATEIVDCAPQDLSFDMAVQVVFRPLSFAGVEGAVIAPLFAPATRL
jgi:uncharacterized OB-fold protein